jgi:hypothetical protein
MVGFDKNKLSDLFKKKDDKEEAKKTTSTKPVKKAPPKTVKPTAKKSTAELDAKIAAVNAKKAASKAKKAEEIMHSKTHQDLINAAYKAAEELKIAPWVLLRAAEWGHFTDDRGKKYDGPMIDDIDTLDDDQKKALKKVLEL